MGDITDKEAIKKVKNGQIDFFAFIVKKYTPKIVVYIVHKIVSHDDREDIIQNTFIQFYKSLKRFDETRPILPYLVEILKNETKMFFRSRRQQLSLDEAILIDEGETLWQLSTTVDIEKIIASLSQNQKKLLQLIQEGYTYKEISKKMGHPLNTIKTWVRRVRLEIQHYNDEKT